jgi:hypothetical protein
LGWGLILLGCGAPAAAFGVVAVVVPESQGQYPRDSPLYQLGWPALLTGPPAALAGLFLTLMEVLACAWTRGARRADDAGASYMAREAARSLALAKARGRAAVLLVGLGSAAAAGVIALVFTAAPERVTPEGWRMGTGEIAFALTLAAALIFVAWRMR